MNIRKITTVAFIAGSLLATLPARVTAQEDQLTGLPGDNFSLQGALDLFKRAGSPEEFEKLLNAGSNDVNNLDLDGDGEVDYIRVVDKMDGHAHAIILQVPISASESQDIAVIEIEKTGNERAIAQIVGDEDIYGEPLIVEPVTEDQSRSVFRVPDYARGPFAGELSGPQRIVVNVWAWPSVRFIFRPGYSVWVSPWRWGHRPVWFRPWRPVPVRVFYPRHAIYHNRFIVVNRHRVMHAHRMYRPVRVTSVTVRTRHGASVGRYRTSNNTTVHRNVHRKPRVSQGAPGSRRRR